jgi:hypothetical protein
MENLRTPGLAKPNREAKRLGKFLKSEEEMRKSGDPEDID